MDKIKLNSLVIIVVILLLLTIYTHRLRKRDIEEAPLPDFSLIPAETGSYLSDDYYIGIESLRVLGADTTLVRSYTGETGIKIELFLGYFARQQENSQIHSPKHCYPGAGWDIIKEDRIEINLNNELESVKRLVITDGKSHRLVIYWFSMNGKAIPDEFSLKYHQMKNTLLSRPQAASFIRFSTGVRPGGDEKTEKTMLRFIERISPDIMSALKSASPVEQRNED
ncbi:MAG: EpsI family protein [Candidatus Krumholzibacteriota bacterium]|nr:EpsI family protein [Candidatus Krumholzibacteriota bacterium]